MYLAIYACFYNLLMGHYIHKEGLYVYLTLILCFLCSILITPIIKKLAFKLGATDSPNQRKVHVKIMPRLGGLAIYISFLLGLLILQPSSPYHAAIVVGGIIILATGMLDDIYDLSAKIKFLLQIIAALIVVMWGGVEVEFINLPFNGVFRIWYL